MTVYFKDKVTGAIMRYRGVLTVWFDRGFGFIATEDRKEYFLHFSQIRYGLRPVKGDVIEFEIGESLRQGKPVQAVRAEIVSPIPALTAKDGDK
jgi:cold shock CspA family protein